MNEAVKKCSACGLYFNGRIYDECPCCKAGQIPGLAEKTMPSSVQQRAWSVRRDARDEPYRGRHSRNKTILIELNKGENK